MDNCFIGNMYDDVFEFFCDYSSAGVYISFIKAYNFPCLPEGFYYFKDDEEKNSFYNIIQFYQDGKPLSYNLIDEKLEKANKDLYDWACSLPENVDNL